MGYRVGCGYVAAAGLTYRDPEEVRRLAFEARIPSLPVALFSGELRDIVELLEFRVVLRDLGRGMSAAQALKAWSKAAREEDRDVRLLLTVPRHYQAAHILKSGRVAKVGYFKSRAKVRTVWELVPK